MLRAFVMLVLASLSSGATAHSQPPKKAGHYLFVWTGDQANQGNDFLIVVDADPASATYGKSITSVVTDQKSVRTHHTEYEMPASGMLFANDHDANRTIIFDLRDPLARSAKATGRGFFWKPRRVQHAAQLSEAA